MEAINNAGAAVGILTSEGVILGAECKQTSKLLEISKLREKIYLFDEHIACAAAGLTSGANILIDYDRRASKSHRYYYQQSMPVEQLVRQICNVKQAYTQHGGLGSFGVGFLYAGWDELLNFQLYSSDPSGLEGYYQRHEQSKRLKRAEGRIQRMLESARRFAARPQSYMQVYGHY